MTHFLVHDRMDTVGVAVVEGIEAGQELTGWVMDTDETIGRLKVLSLLESLPGVGKVKARRLMEEILAKEEEHADDLANLLEDLGGR